MGLPSNHLMLVLAKRQPLHEGKNRPRPGRFAHNLADGGQPKALFSNQSETSLEVESDTDTLILTIVADIQALLGDSLEVVQNVVKEEPALNKKVLGAVEAYTKNSTNLTELLTMPNRGKGIARDTDEYPRKLVPASKEVHQDPDALVLIQFEINGQPKTIGFSKPELIKVVKEVAIARVMRSLIDSNPVRMKLKVKRVTLEGLGSFSECSYAYFWSLFMAVVLSHEPKQKCNGDSRTRTTVSFTNLLTNCCKDYSNERLDPGCPIRKAWIGWGLGLRMIQVALKPKIGHGYLQQECSHNPFLIHDT
ncbi:hypothetical protein Tco_0172829 [Tanacetum coccineum]